MSPIVSLENTSLAFGLHPLLDRIKLQIGNGERICLIGRNGAGKSSLLKVIEGVLVPDSGTLWRAPNLRIASLDQELPVSNQSVYEFVAQGLQEAGRLLLAYQRITDKLSTSQHAGDLKELERLQHEIEARHAWHYEQEIKTILVRLQLNGQDQIAQLSGGWQRRAALAKALVSAPQLLLLDEPTNHLDVEAIEWLEEYLLNASLSLIFITHDRALLQRLATRILELDRGQLTSWPGDYQNFLDRKAELLHAEEKQNADFDKKLAQEEKWIRQGIKARRTRNEGRVRSLEAMRLLRSKRRTVEGKAHFDMKEAAHSGQLVIEAKHISKSFQGVDIIKDFSLRIMRGDRIGLIGTNGAGKSTLLNLLLGKMLPSQGTITLGTKLEIAYFDQLRAVLDLEKSVAENVTAGGDTLEINGEKRHIISYLRDFLFTPERALTPVKALSGGERNRLLLARLFSRANNFLVMDEPTNDLDIETLELLEELLSQYQGTLLLVSHDRKFLDNVVTSTLIFTGGGQIEEHVGGYQSWLAQKEKQAIALSSAPLITQNSQENTKPSNPRANKKLSFKEQQELKDLPQRIEKLEAEIANQEERVSSPIFYHQTQQEISDELAKLKKWHADLEQAYARWQTLENK